MHWPVLTSPLATRRVVLEPHFTGEEPETQEVFRTPLRPHLGRGWAEISTLAVWIPLFRLCQSHPTHEIPIFSVCSGQPAHLIVRVLRPREATQLELKSHLESWARIQFQMSVMKIPVSPLRLHWAIILNKISFWERIQKAFHSNC